MGTLGHTCVVETKENQDLGRISISHLTMLQPERWLRREFSQQMSQTPPLRQVWEVRIHLEHSKEKAGGQREAGYTI